MKTKADRQLNSARIGIVGPAVVLNYVLFRRNLDESIEYLIDFWKNKAVFDRDSSKAKTTGYSWMAAADAEFVRDRISKEAGIVLSVASIMFKKEIDGRWTTSSQLSS